MSVWTAQSPLAFKSQGQVALPSRPAARTLSPSREAGEGILNKSEGPVRSSKNARRAKENAAEQLQGPKSATFCNGRNPHPPLKLRELGLQADPGAALDHDVALGLHKALPQGLALCLQLVSDLLVQGGGLRGRPPFDGRRLFKEDSLSRGKPQQAKT